MKTRRYNSTAKGLMMWAASELEHVGRIISMEDKDIQYAYAMSTLNGMAHLKDAIFEYISTHPKGCFTEDLQITHDRVIRVMKHLIADFDLNVKNIVAFNTRHILSNLSYLKNNRRNRTRRN
jgi:hypothetical protein